jgi:hypothetical protein
MLPLPSFELEYGDEPQDPSNALADSMLGDLDIHASPSYRLAELHFSP